jgi:CO/xanthine dehydrogenase FAD-binding subunit
MRPSPFSLHRPDTLAEASQAILAGARPLAGGQFLIHAMRLRREKPQALVDLTSVKGLSRSISTHDVMLEIGALATLSDVAASSDCAAGAPWIVESARKVGDVQVRNFGTVVGNVCWADPRANLAVALLASDAVVNAAPANGRSGRTIPISEFFVGFRTTALHNEIVTSIRLPISTDAIGCYLEFGRQPQDLAIVSVCIVKKLGTNRSIAVAAGGIADTPIRLPVLEAKFTEDWNRPPSIELICQAIAGSRLQPVRDAFGSPDYKLHVLSVLIGRASHFCWKECAHV